ncbi:hypothetical protein ACFFWE_09455 [Sphaerisporangium melleum]|uniref:hypothetical protein n=1 Tax=Sphaerisporangium melleum TaxID=321316 RepID=UPI00166F34E1|nr:hypothetical protein [Sphaerisporangium melleum]
MDAAPVREHLVWLLGQGMTPLAISRQAGVAHSLLTRLVHGRPGASKPMKRVLEANADAVLSVLPGTASMLRVPVVGAQRRVRGLMWQGWPRQVIAEHAQLAHQEVWRIATDDTSGKIAAGTARRVQIATSRLLTRDPIAAGIDPWRVELARKRAAAAGWVSLLAWDDIEDPGSGLDFGEKVAREQALAEDAEELIHGQGYTLQNAAERLGVSVSYLGDARLRTRKRAAEAVTA